jgi:hypothetical protein
MTYRTIQDTLFHLVLRLGIPESEILKLYFHTVRMRLDQLKDYDKKKQEQERAQMEQQRANQKKARYK